MNIDSFDLKRPLVWVSSRVDGVISVSIYDIDIWDRAGLKLWDAATRSDSCSARSLGPWRTVFETLKKHTGSAGSAESAAPPLLGATLNNRRDGSENPLDPGPVDPETETDLPPSTTALRADPAPLPPTPLYPMLSAA